MRIINAFFAVLFGIHALVIMVYLSGLIDYIRYPGWWCVPTPWRTAKTTIIHAMLSLIGFSLLYRFLTRFFSSKQQKPSQVAWLMSYAGLIAFQCSVPFLIFI